jgi:lipopolysaccharide export system protein LptC
VSEIARTMRREKRSWAAPGSRHDKLVMLLQIILPIGIGVLAAFLVTAPLFAGGDVSFVLDKNKVDIAGERLKVETARYRGDDSKGRAFQLTAGSAVQKSSAEPIVQLNTLAAKIELNDGPAQITANHGRYDLNAEKVAIDGPIKFTAANGYVLDTHDATVDLKSQKLASGGAVTGKTPLGTFSGNQLTADLEGRTVALKGNAHLRIVPRRTK